ncbi:MAG: hypothetical protein JW969_15160 [Spirochaetales bacterium]|nr:hypothetical protein [Spirochaetales bacterium]
MGKAEALFLHLFGLDKCRDKTPDWGRTRTLVDETISLFSARFDCDRWENLHFVIYGNIDAGFVNIIGSTITEEGHLYINDIVEGDEAWVTIGALPKAALAGNMFVTLDPEVYARAKKWLLENTG